MKQNKKMTDRFNFFIPATFEKAKDEKGNEMYKVKGIASTADEDSEGETLIPAGYDLSRFLSNGYLNYNHMAKNDPKYIIGQPTKAEIINGGKELYIEGVLYPTPLAQSVYNTAKTLAEVGSNRSLGWSIEGRPLETDPLNPNRITKAIITNVAITPTPVNKNTILEICKGEASEPFIEYSYDEVPVDGNPGEGKYHNDANGGQQYILDVVREDGVRVMIDKDLKITIIEKCDTAAAGMSTKAGRALIRESLEGKVKELPATKMIRKSVEDIVDGINSVGVVNEAVQRGAILVDAIKEDLIGSFQTLTNQLYYTQTLLEQCHRQTKSGTRHAALGDAYEEFSELKDTIIECIIGTKGVENGELDLPPIPEFYPHLANEAALLTMAVGQETQMFANKWDIPSVENLAQSLHEIGAVLAYKLRMTNTDEGSEGTIDSEIEKSGMIPGAIMFKSELDEEARKKLAAEEEALPNGSFPVRDKKDLANAIKMAGLAKNPDEARNWIKRRAQELDAEDMIPNDWKTNKDI